LRRMCARNPSLKAESIDMESCKWFLYWKREEAKSPWNLIQDTPEARERAIRDGAMFFSTPTLSHPYVDGGAEPNRRDDLVLDLDSKDNPQLALDDLRKLCMSFLPETYGIPTWDIRFYCSGSKGFHAEIPAHFFGMEDGHTELPIIYKRLVQGWVDTLGLTTIDLSMYCMKRGKMFRIANVRRPNGRYKVELSRDDVGYCSIKNLWSLSDSPGGGS
jgi:putative DNA primase/helicase